MWRSTTPALTFQQLLTENRTAIRVRHYSIPIEQTYVNWISQYLKFHQYKNPLLMTQIEANRYLAFLATQKNVAPLHKTRPVAQSSSYTNMYSNNSGTDRTNSIQQKSLNMFRSSSPERKFTPSSLLSKAQNGSWPVFFTDPVAPAGMIAASARKYRQYL